MRANLIVLMFLAGLTVVALGQTNDTDEPIQPVFRLNLDEISHGDTNFVLHRSAKGELVLSGGSGGIALTGAPWTPDSGPYKVAKAIASTDEGRTWHDWPDIRTWPKGWVHDVARRGKELLLLGNFGGLRLWRSQDEGLTWTGGKQFLDLPGRIRNNEKLLCGTGDRILVTREGRLLLSVNFLLGEEGLGPELIGSIVSEDGGLSWRLCELFGPPPGYQDRPEGFGEPKLVELADGRIWMVFRTCLGHLWQAFSSDGGLTWGEPSSTGLTSPAAPMNAQRVPGSNAVVMVWHNAKPTPTTEWQIEHNYWFPRRPLVFAVSHDNCQTWSRPVIITNNVAYMRNIYFSDNEMFIIYLEGTTGTKQWAPGFTYRPKLVIYDLKTVLALEPEK